MASPQLANRPNSCLDLSNLPAAALPSSATALTTSSPDFGTTPLAAIQNGEDEAILAFLEAQWGPGSVHA